MYTCIRLKRFPQGPSVVNQTLPSIICFGRCGRIREMSAWSLFMTQLGVDM